eukprot:SAG31_NODE_124_length_23684_cov_7.200127_2_plen_312_part_00
MVAAQADDVYMLPKTLKKAAVLQVAATDTVAVDVMAVVDPLSTAAHEVGKLVAHLTAALPGAVSASIVLQPRPTTTSTARESPLQLLYSFELPNLDGTVVPLQYSLPANTTLTLALKHPQSWALELAESNADLDNMVIPLNEEPFKASARFELVGLLLSGTSVTAAASVDSVASTQLASSAVELLLGSEQNPHLTDTAVMGDGYFQLRAPAFGSYFLYAGSLGWAVEASTTTELMSFATSVPAISLLIDSFRPLVAELAVSIMQTAVQPGWKRSKRIAGLNSGSTRQAACESDVETIHVSRSHLGSFTSDC